MLLPLRIFHRLLVEIRGPQMEMVVQADEWHAVTTMIAILLLILIFYELLRHIRTVLLCMKGRPSSIPGLPGNHFVSYWSLLITLYKQSSPTCPALALGLQWLWSFCLLYGKNGLLRGTLLFKQAINFHKPETVEALLSDPELIEKSNEYKLVVPWLGGGIFTSGGTKWQKHRKLLTPAFHFSILESYIPVFQEQSEVLVSKLQLRVEEPWIDALPLLSSCTLDIICQTAMGISLKVQNDENCEYFKAFHEICDSIMYRGLRPWLYPDIIFNLTARGRKFKKNIQMVHGLSKKVMKEKKIEMLLDANSTPNSENELEKSFSKKRKPFIELLLEYHLKDPSFTEKDVREEVDTFIFAGHDTTSVTIGWVLYCLGIYQDVQKKVYEELEEIFEMAGSKISRETLTRMKYLESVIKETMRLYPTVPFILRENKRPFKVAGYDVHPGTLCFIFIYALHRDPEYFPDPEKFEPDRFLPENSKYRHPFAYIPFSAGQRNCIGQKFAMIEMKIIISSILRHFRVVSLDSREKVIIYPNLVTRSVKPVRLRFVSR